MKVAIHVWGSEGDVRPSMCLAERLVSSGHEVRLAYSAADSRDYTARLTGALFAHHEVGAGRDKAEVHAVAMEVFADTQPLRQLDRIMKRLLEPVLDELAEVAEADALWADVLVVHPFAFPLAVAAEARRKPTAVLYPTAMVATREFGPPGLPSLGPLNMLLWRLFDHIMGSKVAAALSRVRRRMGLSEDRSLHAQLRESALDLVCLSPTLLPRPADWAKKTHLSGFLSPVAAPVAAAADAALESFFAAGPPPIYVTFGSMTEAERDPHAVLGVVERAVELSGCRAIVQGDRAWAMSRGPSNVFRIGPSAHDQLFPRCAAIVHHGGAGTTQMAFRAGRPAVVVAHMVDQGWWGARLTGHGVAPPHLTRRGLTPERLARAIQLATSSAAMRTRAEELGHLMSREDGGARAVALIEALGHAPSMR